MPPSFVRSCSLAGRVLAAAAPGRFEGTLRNAEHMPIQVDQAGSINPAP